MIIIKDQKNQDKSLQETAMEINNINRTKGVSFSTDKYTVMSNKLVWSKQKMTLQEARLFRILITQSEPEDSEIYIYTCTIQNLADMIGVSSQNIYRDIRKICNKLTKQNIGFETKDPKDPWEYIPVMYTAKYDGQGTVTLALNERLAPFILGLRKNYTQYQLKEILKFSSFYAIRFYELIKSQTFKDNPNIEFRLDKLRTVLDCERKFQRFDNFRQWVIEPSIKDINENSNLVLRNWETITEGRKAVGIKLTAIELPKK